MVVPFDKSIRRVTVLWLVSLAAVALLALSSEVLMGFRVTNSETFAEYVNIAGRQRVLVSQIALHATQYVNADSPAGRATYARRMRQSLDTMRVEQAIILRDVAHVPEVMRVFAEGEAAMAPLSEAYWGAADALLALPPEQVSPDAEAYTYIADNGAYLITRADSVVREILAYNSRTKQSLLRANNVRVAFVVSVVVAQFIFVFRPTLARLRQRANLLETEIAERKRVEAELRASEARFRLLVETAPVGIYQTDPTGATTWVNTHWKEIMGLTEQEATRSLWIDAIHPDDRADALAEGSRQRDSGQPVALDYRIVRPDGAVASLHVSAVPMLDASGERVGMLGTIMDITQRKLAEERALKLEGERQRMKVLGDFIRDTSHDLRTPLTVIKSGLYLCRKLNDVERIHEKVTVLDEHVNYLNVVIDQLQEMAILDATADLTLMPMDVAPLLRDVCNNTAKHPEMRGKSVTVDVEPKLPDAYVSPDRFLGAVRAVVDNARRYTNTGGHIAVSAAREDGMIAVTVEDDGVGIAAEHVPHVFERFYKVDAARGMGGGAGLGLPLAKRVADLHGGTISLRSVPGQGTTVKLTFKAVS